MSCKSMYEYSACLSDVKNTTSGSNDPAQNGKELREQI